MRITLQVISWVAFIFGLLMVAASFVPTADGNFNGWGLVASLLFITQAGLSLTYVRTQSKATKVSEREQLKAELRAEMLGARKHLTTER